MSRADRTRASAIRTCWTARRPTFAASNTVARAQSWLGNLGPEYNLQMPITAHALASDAGSVGATPAETERLLGLVADTAQALADNEWQKKLVRFLRGRPSLDLAEIAWGRGDFDEQKGFLLRSIEQTQATAPLSDDGGDSLAELEGLRALVLRWHRYHVLEDRTW